MHSLQKSSSDKNKIDRKKIDKDKIDKNKIDKNKMDKDKMDGKNIDKNKMDRRKEVVPPAAEHSSSFRHSLLLPGLSAAIAIILFLAGGSFVMSKIRSAFESGTQDPAAYNSEQDSVEHNNAQDSAEHNNAQDSAEHNRTKDSAEHNRTQDSAEHNRTQEPAEHSTSPDSLRSWLGVDTVLEILSSKSPEAPRSSEASVLSGKEDTTSVPALSSSPADESPVAPLSTAPSDETGEISANGNAASAEAIPAAESANDKAASAEADPAADSANGKAASAEADPAADFPESAAASTRTAAASAGPAKETVASDTNIKKTVVGKNTNETGTGKEAIEADTGKDTLETAAGKDMLETGTGQNLKETDAADNTVKTTALSVKTADKDSKAAASEPSGQDSTAEKPAAADGTETEKKPAAERTEDNRKEDTTGNTKETAEKKKASEKPEAEKEQTKKTGNEQTEKTGKEQTEKEQAEKSEKEQTGKKQAEKEQEKNSTEKKTETKKKASGKTSEKSDDKKDTDNDKRDTDKDKKDTDKDKKDKNVEKKDVEKSKDTEDSVTERQKKYVRDWEELHGREFPMETTLHDYNWDYLKYDEMWNLYYKGDKKYKIRRGIDVSEFQGTIDWDEVKKAGYDFVFVRAGHRMFESGELMTDQRAVKNLKRAKKAGLDVGVYVFSQAVSEKEAREEAQLCLDIIEKSGVEITLPVVFDPEIQTEYIARINYISGEQFTDNAVAFCEKIEKAGYTPAIYANCSTETDILDMSRLNDAVIWYADYGIIPESPYRFTFWQYSNTGWVEGIPEGMTDLNVWFVEREEE